MADLLSKIVASLKDVFGPDTNELLQIFGAALTVVVATIGALTGTLKKIWQAGTRLGAMLFGRASANREIENAVSAVADFKIHPISSLRELQIVWGFDAAAYGPGENITFERFQEWWNAYRAGLVAAYRDGKPVGVIGILPITAEWADKLIAREVSEKDLTGDVIRASRRRNWYVSGISLAKRSKGLSRLPIKLICQSVQLWYDKNHELFSRNPIHAVSVGTTVEGRELLHEILRFEVVSAGMKEGEHPIFAREITERQLRTFLTESPASKGSCDPLLLANMPSSAAELSG